MIRMGVVGAAVVATRLSRLLHALALCHHGMLPRCFLHSIFQLPWYCSVAAIQFLPLLPIWMLLNEHDVVAMCCSTLTVFAGFVQVKIWMSWCDCHAHDAQRWFADDGILEMALFPDCLCWRCQNCAVVDVRLFRVQRCRRRHHHFQCCPRWNGWKYYDEVDVTCSAIDCGLRRNLRRCLVRMSKCSDWASSGLRLAAERRRSPVSAVGPASSLLHLVDQAALLPI
mmetsp:Transcript_12886/g.37404  ORF Transcript_12886/g.37404 Transcript_12886/m.37404 type:complete len:226 (+) Transcript_12886:328-1005(+)